ncbi:hypothetical protein F2Q70_00011943 [Brassica cretica]|uniref:Uncharacterized protein n=1 Tax=Brassica cretica TaxID=69181 RepID=A0A8S9LWX1_BRACR|nr:hypothetical protein F2Q70_00011943 [Brassica cretica]
MVEKSIFLSKDHYVLYSSFLLVILIILLLMQGSSVHRHGGIVVVILPIVWTTIDRFFLVIVDLFLICTVDRCCCMSFDRRRVLCLCMWQLNTLHRTWYCKLLRITLLLQCNPLLHLFSDLIEHSPNVLFCLSGLSEEHPQFVGKIGLLEWFLYWNPEDSLLETFHLLLISSFFRCLATFPFHFLKVLPIGALSTSIGSVASSECVMVVSGGLAEGLGCGRSALTGDVYLWHLHSVSSIDALERLSIGFVCSPSIDVRDLALIDTNAIR